MSGKRGLSPVFARVLPFALFIAFLAAQPLLEARFDARHIVVARGVAVAALLALFWRAYAADFRRFGRATRPREWLLAGAVGLAVFGAWITFDWPWARFGASGPGFVPLDAAGRLDPALVALRVAQIAIVVPLMEELFWRSFLLRWIDGRDFLARDPRRASALAIALCAGLFALEHTLWLAGLLAGLAYTLLYVRTGDLRLPLVAHGVTNAVLAGWILATGNWHFW